VHVVDVNGMVLKSDVTAEMSITGKMLVGTCVDEFLEQGDINHYMDCIKAALTNGLEFCAYSVQEHDFLSRMTRIISRRVRVIKVDVTGLNKRLGDVLKLV
jgi:hypothetical protein